MDAYASPSLTLEPAGIFHPLYREKKKSHVPIIFVWCRGSQQCVAGPQAHKRATHVLLCWCRRRSRRVHACQGRRAEQRRCRGDEDTRARRRPAEWIGPSPRVKLTSPRSPRAEPPGHRRCDHGGAPPYTEAPCSARRRPAAPPPAVPPCLYPSISPSAFIASACMPTAHLHPRRAPINTGAKQQGQSHHV
jgi:hypothetical protein